MKQSFEEIINKTLDALVRFFKIPKISNHISSQKQSTIVYHLESARCPEMYYKMETFLRTTKLLNMHSSILEFAKTLPNYTSFEKELESSLVLHERIWNQVYENLKLAQQALC